VPGRFEPNLPQLQEFNLEDVLVVRGMQKVNEQHGKRMFIEVVFNIPNVGDFMPQDRHFSFYVPSINRVCIFLSTTLYVRSPLDLKVRNCVFLSRRAFVIMR
jgi:hypothetical protein